MLNTIKQLLHSHTKLSDWILSESRSSSLELFFISDKLDMNRSTDVTTYSVKVFVDFTQGGEQYRGHASILLNETDTEAEMQNKIDDAVINAGYVRNKWYDLPTNADPSYPEMTPVHTKADLEAKSAALHHTLFQAYPYTSKVNSCEVFATEEWIHTVTSKGTDVTYPVSSFTFEIVTESNEGKEPVEIFNGYELKQVDLAEIERIVKQQLLETEGRSKAVRNPKMTNKRLILSGDAVEDFLGFYLDHATDAMIYQGNSRAKLGERFTAQDASQKLNIRINPFLETSVHAKLVDGEGKLLSAYPMYEDGVVKNIRTSARFSHYMNIQNIGMCGTFEVEGGEYPLSSYLDGEYIEILAFSSFLVDPSTGDFGGEFRLAKHVKNGEVRFITGGSISENIFVMQNTMQFSKELQARKLSNAPKAIIFENVTVAGE